MAHLPRGAHNSSWVSFICQVSALALKLLRTLTDLEDRMVNGADTDASTGFDLNYNPPIKPHRQDRLTAERQQRNILRCFLVEVELGAALPLPTTTTVASAELQFESVRRTRRLGVKAVARRAAGERNASEPRRQPWNPRVESGVARGSERDTRARVGGGRGTTVGDRVTAVDQVARKRILQTKTENNTFTPHPSGTGIDESRDRRLLRHRRGPLVRMQLHDKTGAARIYGAVAIAKVTAKRWKGYIVNGTVVGKVRRQCGGRSLRQDEDLLVV